MFVVSRMVFKNVSADDRDHTNCRDHPKNRTEANGLMTNNMMAPMELVDLLGNRNANGKVNLSVLDT